MQNILLSGTVVTVVVRKEEKEKRIETPIEHLRSIYCLPSTWMNYLLAL